MVSDRNLDRSSNPVSASREECLARLLHECCERVEAGEHPNVDAVVAAHPELAPDLGPALAAVCELRSTSATDAPFHALGDYQILSELGRGGMGVVYEAWHAPLDRRAALKVLPEGSLGKPKAVTRFLREAKVTAKLQHPNIVSVYEMGIEGGRPYIALEFMTGETLARLLRRLQRPETNDPPPGDNFWVSLSSISALFRSQDHEQAPPPTTPEPQSSDTETRSNFDSKEINVTYCIRVAEAFAGAAEGLHYAHGQGIIHRDVKPSNLFLDQTGRLRVLDFGLAHLEGLETLTASGEFLGTPLYMSPEQVPGQSHTPVDHRTDIYSFGATMYEMLSWRPPFRGGSYHETLSQIVSLEPVQLRTLNPRVPPDLQTIVHKCLEKAPSDRYATAEALAQDLRRFVRGDPIEARPRTVWERFFHRVKRRKGRVAVACLTALLVLSSAMLVRTHMRDLRRERVAEYERLVVDGAMKIELAKPGERYRRVKGRTLRPLLPPDSDSVAFADAPHVTHALPDPAEQAVAVLTQATAILVTRPDAHYHLARARMLLGDTEKARESLKQALKCDATFVPALLLEATLLEDAQQQTMARIQHELKEGLREPSWAAAWLRAWRARREEKWGEAAEAAGEVLRLRPAGQEPYLGFLVSVLLARGHAHLEAGQLDKALENFAIAHGRWPDLAEPVILLGKTYWLKENSEEGDRRFEELVARSERRTEVVFRIAAVYQELQQAEKGLSWLEQQLAKSALREAWRARFLLALKREIEALAAARESVSLDPEDSEGYVRLGDALLQNDELQEAEAAYREALARGAVTSVVHDNLGVVLMQQHKFAQAAAAHRTALELDSRNVRARIHLAGTLRMLRRYDEAISEYRRVLDTGRMPGEALCGLGNILMDQGKHEDAFAAYCDAVQNAPDYPLAHCYIGSYFYSTGKHEEALTAFREALRIEADHTRALSMLGRVLRHMKRFSEAEKTLRAAVASDERDWDAHNNLGNLLGFTFRRFAEALLHYDRALLYSDGKEDMFRSNYQNIITRAARSPKGHYQLRESLNQNLRTAEVHDRILLEVLRHGLGDGTDPRITRAVERFEVRWDVCEDPSPLELMTHAYVVVRGIEGGEADEAIECARTAAERWDTPEAFIDLTEILREAGKKEDAVWTLEGAVARFGTRNNLYTKLDAYRKELLPDLVTYDSIDDALEAPQFVVGKNNPWRVMRGTEEPSPELEWTLPDFDDTAWEVMASGFGYGSWQEGTTVQDMKGSYTTLYARHVLYPSDLEKLQELRLIVRTSGGCTAYLNGVEVARLRAGSRGERLPHDAVTSQHTAELTAIEVELDLELLRADKNVVAVQGLDCQCDKPNFWVVPLIFGTYTPDLQRDRVRFEQFLAAATQKGALQLIAYFEGRLLQRSGTYGEAVPCFEEVLRHDRAHAEPFVALAESLRLANEPTAALSSLNEALRAGFHDSRAMVDLWFTLMALDTGCTLPTILRALPDDAEGHVEALAWAMGRWQSNGVVRINCGGPEYRNVEHIQWGKDRFYLGGNAAESWHSPLEVTDTEDDVLFQTERWFPPSDAVSAYKIPVIPGTYRVKLYCCEWAFTTVGQRRFAVTVERHKVLDEYAPRIRRAGVTTYDTPVTDGFLDIVFTHGTRNNPKIDAIAVERLE